MTGRNNVEVQVFEFEIEASPDKIWRAVIIPEFRNQWLPENTLVDGEPLDLENGRSVRYRIRDDEPPFTASAVTFEVEPSTDGFSVFRITHTRHAKDGHPAANTNVPASAQMVAA